MNGYNFTDRVRRTLQVAREESARHYHEYVAPEHLFLGVLHDVGSLAVEVLNNLGAVPANLRDAVEASLVPGKGGAVGPDLPYTSRGKKVLELAMSEARELGHSYVGTEHLLLGLLREEKGIPAQILKAAGVSLESARAEMVRLLNAPDAPLYRREALAPGPDQYFKTLIALIELHRVRFGAYPASLEDLQFLGFRDRDGFHSFGYQRLAEGYALDWTSTGPLPPLKYPAEFWRGLGLRRSNLRPSDNP